MTTDGPASTLPNRLRRGILLTLVLLTMAIAAFGVTRSVGELSWAARPDNRTLAASLAMVALGTPAFALSLAMTVRQLELHPSMRLTRSWQLHTTIALSIALIGSIVGAVGLTADAIRLTAFDAADLAMLTTWGTIGLLYWRFLLPRFPTAADHHVAVASVIALGALAIGQVGLLRVVLDRVFRSLSDPAIGDIQADSAPWGALFIVAAFAWIGIWLRRYERAPRTGAWHVVTVVVGTALGFTAWLVSVARLGWLMAVWVAGDRLGRTALDHFDSAPAWIAVGLTGGISFLYHRSLIDDVPVRNDPIRLAEHLVLFTSLAAAVTGTVALADGLFDPAGADVNTTLAGAITMLAGGCVVAGLVTSMAATDRADGPVERSSAVRRTYYLSVFAIGTVVALFAGIDALTGIFEDLLDGDATTSTFASRRSQLATVAVVVPVLWLHQLVRERTPDRPTTTAMAT